MTDESVDTFYSCTLCQSFAPDHVCVITPERPGLCGAYNWLDGKAAFEITPTGPNQPIQKGDAIESSARAVEGRQRVRAQELPRGGAAFSAYSLMEDPMTSCGCFEAIAVLLPMCQRRHDGGPRLRRAMTPCGMPFSTLAGSVGGGAQTPGFVGISKFYIGSKKFISADGGIKRIAWLPKTLKESMKDVIEKRGAEEGCPDLYDKIATEENGTTEEEVHGVHAEGGSPGPRDGADDVGIRPGGQGLVPRPCRTPRDRSNIREPRVCRRKEIRTMGLTGIQIYKMLPQTNCKDCGEPTCLAFAMKLAAGKAELVAVPLRVRRGQGEALRGQRAADPRGGPSARATTPTRWAARP